MVEPDLWQASASTDRSERMRHAVRSPWIAVGGLLRPYVGVVSEVHSEGTATLRSGTSLLLENHHGAGVDRDAANT
jgi:hypothetical protein